MKTKRIKISESDDIIFNELKKQKNMTSDELFSMLIHDYYTNQIHDDNIKIKIANLEEYIKLLVKANTNLPREEEEMKKLVQAETRFAKVISEKVKEND